MIDRDWLRLIDRVGVCCDFFVRFECDLYIYYVIVGIEMIKFSYRLLK